MSRCVWIPRHAIFKPSLFSSIFEKPKKPQWLMFIISGPIVAKWEGGRIPGSDGWQAFSGQNVKDLFFFSSFCGFCSPLALAKYIYGVVVLTGHQSSVCNIAKDQSSCLLWTLVRSPNRMASSMYAIFWLRRNMKGDTWSELSLNPISWQDFWLENGRTPWTAKQRSSV